MNTKWLLSCFVIFMSSCGFNGEQKFTTTTSGETHHYVVIRLEFIKEMNELCKQKFLMSDYASEELYNQEVSKCTLEALSFASINPATIADFRAKYCQPDSDLSDFTPKEQGDILAACAALGVSQ